MIINLQNGQKVFFSSDTHYNHANICKATSSWPDTSKTRDFKSLEHMNSTVVDNINSMVGEDDILFHLGDWSFGGFDKIKEFRNRIICKNIHLILGNHDHHIENNIENIRDMFSSVNHYLELKIRIPSSVRPGEIDRFKFILCHYPIASWNGMNYGDIHLHGHVHLPKNQRISEGRAMDVGMDGNEYSPLGLFKVLNLLKNQPIKRLSLPEDHHEKI